MIKISSQLRKYFIGIALLSVLFITIISNISIKVFFSNYLQETRAREDLQVIQYIEQVYRDYKGFSPEFLMSTMHYTMSQGLRMRIYDHNDHIIWDGKNLDSMHRMMHQRKEEYDEKELTYYRYPLAYDGIKIGSIDIGRPKGIISSLQDRQFLYTMNGVFVIALIFSVLIATLSSTRISRRFLDPIYKIKENAKHIERGKYKDLDRVRTNTYELYNLSESINELAKKLDEQESLRRRMTTDIAHELRTPLATIQSHIEAFMDGVWQPNMDNLSTIHREIIRLTRLIKELSDLSIVENDEIKIGKRKVNLSLLLHRVIENFQPMLMDKKISLHKQIQGEIQMMGDDDLLNRIVVNILSNAHKYTNEEGKIYVTLEQFKDKIQLMVEDTGIGIPEEDLKHIFERFYRSDYSRSRGTGGTGIGLTLTKVLVEAHGGTITIESEEGEGTKVVIQLPKE